MTKINYVCCETDEEWHLALREKSNQPCNVQCVDRVEGVYLCGLPEKQYQICHKGLAYESQQEKKP